MPRMVLYLSLALWIEVFAPPRHYGRSLITVEGAGNINWRNHAEQSQRQTDSLSY